MHKDEPLVEARIARLVRDRVDPAVHRRSAPVTIEAWEVPGEPVPFDSAVQQAYEPFTVGSAWGGRPWGTTWFRITGTVPADFGTAPGTTAELLVDLGFTKRHPGFQAEGLAYRTDGSTIKGVEPRNDTVPVEVGPGESFELYVEAGANPDIGGDSFQGATPLGSRSTAGDEPIYRVRSLELVERDDTVWELQQDLWVLRGLMAELPTDGTRGADVLHALELAADALDPDDVAGTAADAREVLAPVLAVPASAAAHRAIAVGHAHIDSAWLWPVRETIRKCARTFSNVLDLMDRDPDFTFACSSAQQYAWIRDGYPSIWARIKQRVAEGRWIPVGGMWVESDTNLPGGEALARQFVAGKRFFLEEFGIDTPEAWLPDSFGYSGALPQIVRAAGSKWFVTQKPSWNETNVMPHTSFHWEGIDGSRILTHLPPADTYNSDVSAADLHRGERNNKERGVANTSMLLYGFGDGGGGPTREMVAAARRQHDLDGSPRVQLGTPAQVFEELERVLPTPGVWSGEMYLEFHRGTYTSQIRTKQGNRRSEHLLREAELWASTAAVRLGLDYPYEELERAWHTVLLQQFHDILPGSSIAWVYENAEENYAQIAEVLEGLIGNATTALANGGAAALAGVGASSSTARRQRRQRLARCAVRLRCRRRQRLVRQRRALQRLAGRGGRRNRPGWFARLGAATRASRPLRRPLRLRHGRRHGDHRRSRPRRVARRPRQRPRRDRAGRGRRRVHRLPRHPEPVGGVGHRPRVPAQRHRADGLVGRDRRLLARGGTVLRVVDAHDPVLGASPGSQSWCIETEVDWHEHQKLLKLAFPLDVRASSASSEIQFGHIDRPTHQNTSWDHARFETSAHRWVHVAEPGFGVAVANDSTYGHDITRSTRPDGGTTTLVRESLLRGPTFPDPNADQGHHVFRTVLRVGASVLDAADSGLPAQPAGAHGGGFDHGRPARRRCRRRRCSSRP